MTARVSALDLSVRRLPTHERLALFTDSALGDQHAARRLYEEALSTAPEDPWTNGRFADVLRRAGELDAALEQFERAVAGKEPDHDALLQYAELQVRQGSPGSAVELLRRALKLRPRNPNALTMLAQRRRSSELRRPTWSGCIGRPWTGSQTTQWPR
jgi:predicted Zn-dependent protease